MIEKPGGEFVRQTLLRRSTAAHIGDLCCYGWTRQGHTAPCSNEYRTVHTLHTYPLEIITALAPLHCQNLTSPHTIHQSSRCTNPITATYLNEQVPRVISHAHISLSKAPASQPTKQAIGKPSSTHPPTPNQSTTTQYNFIRPEPSIPSIRLTTRNSSIHLSTPSTSRWVCGTNLIYESGAVHCRTG